jgi:hypothetical protein
LYFLLVARTNLLGTVLFAEKSSRVLLLLIDGSLRFNQTFP